MFHNQALLQTGIQIVHDDILDPPFPYKEGAKSEHHRNVLKVLNLSMSWSNRQKGLVLNFVYLQIKHTPFINIQYENLKLILNRQEDITRILAKIVVKMIGHCKTKYPQKKFLTTKEINDMFENMLDKTIAHVKKTKSLELQFIGLSNLDEWESIYLGTYKKNEEKQTVSEPKDTKKSFNISNIDAFTHHSSNEMPYTSHVISPNENARKKIAKPRNKPLIHQRPKENKESKHIHLPTQAVYLQQNPVTNTRQINHTLLHSSSMSLLPTPPGHDSMFMQLMETNKYQALLIEELKKIIGYQKAQISSLEEQVKIIETRILQQNVSATSSYSSSPGFPSVFNAAPRQILVAQTSYQNLPQIANISTQTTSSPSKRSH